MRAILLFPLAVLAACAGPTAKDLEKMSTVEVCYLGIVEPEKSVMVDAEIQRRKANCQDYEAQLKKMADQELRAGGSGPSGSSEAAKAAMPSGGMGGAGMGRY